MKRLLSKLVLNEGWGRDVSNLVCHGLPNSNFV
jgi:hypothetical protein